MIHLAIDAIGARYGGSATELVDILNAVVKDPRVAEITMFCSPQDKRLFKIPSSDKLIEVPKPWIDRNYLLRILWFEWLLGAECKRIGADILLVASNFGKGGFGIPHVTYVQQSLPFSEEAIRTFRSILQTAKISAIRWQMMRSCRSAACVICQSSVMKRWLSNAFHLEPERLKVIYTAPKRLNCAVGSEPVLESRGVETFKPDRLLFVGVDYPYKKLETIVGGMELILQLNPLAELCLTLPSDHRYASKPGIKCIGYLNDEQLASAYQYAAALVLPSLVESGPQSPIEAMSLGTPVLVADRPYAHDICEDAAMFFDPLSPEDFAEKAIQLVRDQILRKTLIERGFALIERRRTAKPYQKIVDILVDIATSSRTRQTPNFV